MRASGKSHPCERAVSSNSSLVSDRLMYRPRSPAAAPVSRNCIATVVFAGAVGCPPAGTGGCGEAAAEDVVKTGDTELRLVLGCGLRFSVSGHRAVNSFVGASGKAAQG